MSLKRTFVPWDYLIVTASNDEQAEAYRQQLSVREKLGLFSGIKHVLVFADPGAKRIGSGGSTIFCIKEIIALETVGRSRVSTIRPIGWNSFNTFES